MCTTTPSGNLRTSWQERNLRQSASCPKLWSCKIDRLSDRLTAVTDYPHVPELPIAQGIGTPICGCLGFRCRVSEVRIFPGPLHFFIAKCRSLWRSSLWVHRSYCTLTAPQEGKIVEEIQSSRCMVCPPLLLPQLPKWRNRWTRRILFR